MTATRNSRRGTDCDAHALGVAHPRITIARRCALCVAQVPRVGEQGRLTGQYGGQSDEPESPDGRSYNRGRRRGTPRYAPKIKDQLEAMGAAALKNGKGNQLAAIF